MKSKKLALLLGSILTAVAALAAHTTDRRIYATDIVKADGTTSVLKLPTTAPTASKVATFNADGELTSSSVDSSLVDYLGTSTAISVLGRSANSSGAVAPIAAGTNGFVLNRASNALTFSLLGDANIDGAAAIARSKTASGTAYRILANNSSGVMSENAAITASRAVVSDANGQLTHASTTAAEIGYVNGVTSAIQTQLNAKVSTTLNSAQILVGNGSNVATAVTPSGDVTINNSGVTAIGSNKVTNSMLSTMATASFKGRTTAGTGNVEDLSASQATSILSTMVGDSGSGGTKGLVGAPASGDAAANKFWRADATWAIPPGSPGSFVSWTGYHDDDCYWVNSNTSYSDFSADASCTFSTLYNNGMGTVTSTGSKTPGITFTPPQSGDYEVCAIANMGATGATSVSFRLYDGTSVIGYASGDQSGDMTKPICGIFDATASVGKSVSIQYKVISGTSARINATQTDVSIFWTLKFLEAGGGGGGSSAPTFASKTSNYTITSSDNVVSVDSSGGAFTLTLPTPSSVTGRMYTIRKSSSDFKAVTIARAASETLCGKSASSSVDTFEETLSFYSDGTNWIGCTRSYNSDWTAFTQTLKSTGGAPDPAISGSASVNKCEYQRMPRGLKIRCNIEQAASGTTGASGNYLWVIPNSSDVTIDTSSGALASTNATSVRMLGSGSGYQAGNINNTDCWPTAYDTTRLWLPCVGTTPLGTSYVPLGSGSKTVVSFDAEVPITGWN